MKNSTARATSNQPTKAQTTATATAKATATTEKENKTTATATDKDTSKRKTAKAQTTAQTIARIDNNNIIVKVIKQTIDNNGVKTETTEKKIPVPANAKTAQLANLANLIQCKVLIQQSEKYSAELVKATALKKNQAALTEEQKNKKQLINAKIKLNKKLMESYGLDEDKLKVVISEPMAEILASYITGQPLSLELNNLKTCLRFNYQTIANLLDRLLKGETVTTTEEEQAVFTTLRQGLKKDLERYTKESFYFNQFKLSISLTDIRKWYEVSRLDIANDTFIFDDKKDTTLSKAIVKWFLTKLKVEAKEEEPTPAEKTTTAKAGK